MAKARDPKRDEAWELFKKKKGKITPKEIAEKLGIDPKRVREWKCKDRWAERLPKRGGQPGNKNAKGNSGGAPKGNRNAETHGAYSIPRIESWAEDERERLENLPVQFDSLAESQLKALLAKQFDLEKRIAALSDDEGNQDGEGAADQEPLYLDRIMTMMLPDGGEMKYRSESSAFSRRMTLEAELNRVQGRIQKMMDSIRTREETQQRFQFEREKFEFNKQKTLGEFCVDENGNITQEENTDSIEEITE